MSFAASREKSSQSAGLIPVTLRVEKNRRFVSKAGGEK
jgi:hypothetical protein